MCVVLDPGSDTGIIVPIIAVTMWASLYMHSTTNISYVIETNNMEPSLTLPVRIVT